MPVRFDRARQVSRQVWRQGWRRWKEEVFPSRKRALQGFPSLAPLARLHADRGRSHALMTTTRDRTRSPTGKRPENRYVKLKPKRGYELLASTLRSSGTQSDSHRVQR